MWSENEETDRQADASSELGEDADCMNYDHYGDGNHSLGQMLHKQPEDLSILLWQLVDQAVDGLDTRLWTAALCRKEKKKKRPK